MYRCVGGCDLVSMLTIANEKYVCYNEVSRTSTKCGDGKIAISYDDFNNVLGAQLSGPYGKCTTISNNIIYEEDPTYKGLYSEKIIGTADANEIFTNPNLL